MPKVYPSVEGGWVGGLVKNMVILSVRALWMTPTGSVSYVTNVIIRHQELTVTSMLRLYYVS